MYSVMWSEHCSYKSSKVHLRYFGETTTDAMRARMLAGIGENAGVVDIGDGWAVTFKVESHNHPSYVEPYQGAATGVGGIVRDIMAMGARPIAVADPLRFGPADAPDTAPGAARGGRRASAATATASACPTSAARSSSTRATRAIRWSTPCASARCGSRTCTWRSPPAPATRSSCSARGPGSTASAGSRCWRRDLRATTRLRATGRKKLPSRAGRRPVHREGAHRVLPGAVRRRAGGRHPGPRRRRAVLRDLRAGQRRRRRHAHRAGRACRCAPPG